MEETAYAKINLALHVRSREWDGYHAIETLFAFAEDGDRLSVKPADRLALQVTGPFASQLGASSDNLVLRAAEALRARYGVVQSAALGLDKRLPVASGIGGGSADAAAALRLLVRWWALPFEEETLLEIARTLGADVSACLRSEPAIGTGRGDRLEPLAGFALAGRPLLLVNPRLPLSTASVFAAWDGVDRGGLDADPAEWRNDLEGPARAAAPEIGTVLEDLQALPGASFSRMSGSGATCFALFDRLEERDAAAGQIAASHPDWWVLATRLR